MAGGSRSASVPSPSFLYISKASRSIGGGSSLNCCAQLIASASTRIGSTLRHRQRSNLEPLLPAAHLEQTRFASRSVQLIRPLSRTDAKDGEAQPRTEVGHRSPPVRSEDISTASGVRTASDGKFAFVYPLCRSQCSRPAAADLYHLGRVAPVGRRRHCRRDPGRGAVRDCADRIVRQVRIDFRRAGLLVPEHFADQVQAVAIGHGERCEGMPQVVYPPPQPGRRASAPAPSPSATRCNDPRPLRPAARSRRGAAARHAAQQRPPRVARPWL